MVSPVSISVSSENDSDLMTGESASVESELSSALDFYDLGNLNGKFSLFFNLGGASKGLYLRLSNEFFNYSYFRQGLFGISS